MIKLLVPKHPPIEAALPYIKRAEEARWYSNFGRNALEIEDRLAEYFAGAYVVTCSSCTAGLEMAYTLARMRGFKAIDLPALTFPATWMAAIRSGLEIRAVDVDAKTWVSPYVSGFGLPTYGPIVDAAAAIGEQRVPLLREGMTAVFSMHCTKPLSAGEGGFIVTWDQEDAGIFRSMSNFGFPGNGKPSHILGWNAKLSEYHAAVALAGLDAWDRDPWLNLFDWYEKYLPACVVKQERPRGVYPVIAVKLPVPAQPVLERMASAGIECRRWYIPTLDRHRGITYKHVNKLTVTADLEKHLLGLPWHLWLTEADVAQVCERLEECVREVELKEAA